MQPQAYCSKPCFKSSSACFSSWKFCLIFSLSSLAAVPDPHSAVQEQIESTFSWGQSGLCPTSNLLAFIARVVCCEVNHNRIYVQHSGYSFFLWASLSFIYELLLLCWPDFSRRFCFPPRKLSFLWEKKKLFSRATFKVITTKLCGLSRNQTENFDLSQCRAIN